MTDTPDLEGEAMTGPSPESPRPDFMGPELLVGGGGRADDPAGGDTGTDAPSPSGGSGTPPRRAWIPISIAGALLVGIGLGIGGTLLVTGGDTGSAQPEAQAAAGPGNGSGTASQITLPQVDGGDPDAFGTVEITGTALPRLDGSTDLAVGMAAPTLSGFDFEGNPVAVTNDGRAKIVLLLAHWCPYCQDEVPVVRDWVAAADIPDDVDVYSVVTLTDFTRGNYPPRTWLEQEGWNVPLIVDDSNDSAAQAFGLNAVPFWVLIDADGTIAGRGAGGGIPADALDAIARQLSATAAPSE
jgi:thiol-disulfide isomerase/thioredoxin